MPTLVMLIFFVGEEVRTFKDPLLLSMCIPTSIAPRAEGNGWPVANQVIIAYSSESGGLNEWREIHLKRSGNIFDVNAGPKMSSFTREDGVGVLLGGIAIAIAVAIIVRSE